MPLHNRIGLDMGSLQDRERPLARYCAATLICVGYENSKQSLEAADRYLDQAIKLDPDYAHAWNDKAVIAALQAETGVRTPNDGFERARQFAQHALRRAEAGQAATRSPPVRSKSTSSMK